nr:MAG TPA: minor tail protein [Caudoviricetes sp.]
MADGGTIDLNKLKQVVDVETILDKRKLNAVLKTLETSLSGENISKYFKGTDTLLDDLQEAYKKFNRSMSDTDAKNLVNINNILKALKVDTASLVPNFEEIGTVIEKAEQKSKGLRGIIKVQDFKDVFVALNQFKEYGLDIEEIFGKLGAKGNFSELSKQLEQQAQTIERYRNKVSALRDELRDAENASGVSDLRSKLNNLTDGAKETFEAFLKLNNIGRMDEWGYYDSSKFSEYFDAIENGSMSAQEAITKFKAEYGYLLEDSFKNSNNTFGLEQLRIFQDTLDQVLTTVEDFHRKLDTLPDDMKNIQSSEKSGQVLFDEEQLKSVLNVFGDIKDHLSSLRSVISDVGDGEELSPLLKTIEKVSEAVSNLNMKFNMNIDVGSDNEMEQELQKKASNALLAYENLREHLFRTYRGDNYTSELLYKFDPSQFDTTIGKIEGYKKFIENLRASIKENYGHDKLYEDSDKSYWNKASAAYGQITKVRNAMKADSEGSPLDNLFGGKTDLTEVIEQLKLIVTELGKVSSAAADIKTSLGEGIQLNDSLQQIETLTQKVQALETELTSLKSSTPLPSSETNLSSEFTSMEQVQQATNQAAQAKEDFAKANAGVQTSVDESKSPLQLEAELMNQIAESAKKAADAKKEFVEANGKVAASTEETATDNQNKQYYEDIIDGAQEAGQSIEKNFSRINELVLVQDEELKNHVATWKLLKQVGEFGKDSNVSLRFQSDNGQIENRYYKRNDYGDYDLRTKVSVTDYEKITKLIVDADNELRKLEDRRDKILSNNPTASVSGIEEAIEYQREYIKAIEETISYMRQQQEYALKGPQIDKARDEALEEYTRRKAIFDDEKNSKNDKRHQKNLNELDSLPKYEELSSELEVVKDKIEDYHEQLMAGAISTERYDQLVKDLITDYKELVKIKEQITKIDLDEKASAEKKLEQEKEAALKWTKSQSQRLSDAISKYSYGDTSDAKAMMQQMNNGLLNFGDFSNIQGNMLNLQKTIDQIISSLKRAHEENLAAINAEVKAEESETKIAWNEKLKAVREYISAVERLNELVAQDKGTGKNASAIEKQQEKVERLKNDAIEAKDTLDQLVDSKAAPADALAQWVNTAEKLDQALTSADSAMQKAQESIKAAQVSELKSMMDGLNKYEAKMREFSNRDPKDRSSNYSDALKSYSDTLTKYRNELSKFQNHPELVDEAEIKKLKSMREELDKAATSFKGLEKGSTAISRDKLITRISDYMKKNSAMSKEFKSELEGLIQKLKMLGPAADTTDIADQFFKISQRIREAGQEGKKFFDVVKEKAWYGLAGTIGTYFGFNDIIEKGKQIAQTVTNINSKIIDLAKVSEASSTQIYKDFDSYAEIAKNIGGTISDTIDATAAWSKNGYNIPDSKELARVSQLYKNVGDDIDIQGANESLISTLKGFQLQADQAEHIVDVFNEVSNNEAISSSGIGTALQRSAASFNAANTSLEKSVALITATNSVLQDEEKTGNMWKTVSARLRGADAELKSMGEDTEGMVESTSKLRDLIKGMTGFDIMKDENTFKDIYDIVLGIGEKWDSLSDVNRASLLEKLAGKNQSNALAAALSNIDVLKKSYQEALNANGSAMREQEEYQKSIQYSIDQTKAKLEELSNDFMSSDFLKGAIDAGGKLVDILDLIVNKLGVIPTMATALSAALSFNNVGRDKMYSLTCF